MVIVVLADIIAGYQISFDNQPLIYENMFKLANIFRYNYIID